MKWKLSMLIAALSIQLAALDPPKPISGIPNVLAGKQFSLTAGRTAYVFAFPEGWGMGDTSAVESQGRFTLFPKEGGYGCAIDIDRFDNETLAKDEADRISRTFSSVQDLPDGFESVQKTARYACRVSGVYLVQIWYVLPKRSREQQAIWEKLKACVRVSEEKKKEAPAAPEEGGLLVEVPWKGWLCNHPNGLLHVLVERNLFYKTVPNLGSDKKYLLEIGDMHSSGFFYMKWDEKNSKESLQAHLDEIRADVQSFEKKQSCESAAVFPDEEKWAYLRGDPYTLISVAGDGFLFGFALKNTSWGRSFKVNEYVNRVGWYRTNP
jgi:hypothetical protein